MSISDTEKDPPFESAPANDTAPDAQASGEQTPGEQTEAPAPDDGGASAGQIAELTAAIEQLKNEKLMALAEAENAGKRADKRIADNAKYAVSNVCKSLLSVMDNLNRALLAAPPEARAQNETVKNLAVGVELTEKELSTVLESQGVRRIESLNQPFDANRHNAVQEVENTEVPSGTVVQVLQDGYLIHDRLLRPAMVIVSRGGPKREAQPKPAAPAGSAPGPDGVDTTA